VREELRDTVSAVVAEHGDEIEAAATEMKPCEYCATQHYEEYILRELLNRTLTGLSEDGELDQLFD
jgi:ABC-type amino acid transport substrate-binding protein